jgi:LysM repeat protein
MKSNSAAESTPTEHVPGERPLLRWGLNLTIVVLLGLVGVLLFQRLRPPTAQVAPLSEAFAPAEPLPAAPAVTLTPLESGILPGEGIWRQVEAHTIIPNRPRAEVVTYTVDAGDTLFSIADRYRLKPESILWGNYETLNGDPHFLRKEQVLNVLPIDGVYYQWQEGDTVAGVAAQFKADPQDILDYPGNHFDLAELEAPGGGMTVGAWVIIPGGSRPIEDWGPPAISRDNPASAKFLGDGSCGSVYTGAVGSGSFVWPTTDRSISGYNYSGIHPAIDIGGALGNAVFAADSGVIVYAGWSNRGYGNLVVIDHGNGFQTVYGHLSTVGAACGQSVFQGGYIGAVGSTGNSSGPHLHFELIYNGAKPNPLDYLQ